MKLLNKKILITGATSGIGLSILAQLYDTNTLYIIARSPKKIEQIKLKYPKVQIIKANLTELDDIQKALTTLKQLTNEIDVLINNAAVQYTAKYIDDDFMLDTITEEINCNFTAICIITYLTLPLLQQAKSASIVNINSGLALAPKTSSAIYCATKSALNSFSQSLRYQLTNTDISVLQVFLPLVDTPMTQDRNQSKLDPDYVSRLITAGIEKQTLDNDIGKVKILRVLLRLWPALAKKIMRAQ